MLRTCGSCGRIVDDNHICPNRKKEVKKDTKANAFRQTYEWQMKSKEIRVRDLYLCAVCRAEGRFNYNNLSVHHIIPIEQDYDKRLDNDNLICLCARHHDEAEKGRITREELYKLIDERK